MVQVVVWVERKVNQSGRWKWVVGENEGMERERGGRAQCRSVLGPAQLCGFTAAFHCLGRPRNRSSLPPSLPSLISPPRFASCHLSSPLLLSSLHLLSFFPVHSSLVFLLKPSSLSPFPIPYIHPSSHWCNVLFRSAFLPYKASKVTLSRGVCVLHCCGHARMHMCMYQFMFACLPLLKYMLLFLFIRLKLAALRHYIAVTAPDTHLNLGWHQISSNGLPDNMWMCPWPCMCVCVRGA